MTKNILNNTKSKYLYVSGDKFKAETIAMWEWLREHPGKNKSDYLETLETPYGIFDDVVFILKNFTSMCVLCECYKSECKSCPLTKRYKFWSNCGNWLSPYSIVQTFFGLRKTGILMWIYKISHKDKYNRYLEVVDMILTTLKYWAPPREIQIKNPNYISKDTRTKGETL